jgi:hypothetical protein
MKKLLAIIMCVCVLSSTTAYAEGPVRLLKDNPFTPTTNGWFFTDTQEQKLRFRLVEGNYFEEEIKLLNANILLQKSLNQSQEEISEKYRAAWLQSDEQLTKVLKKQNRTKFFYLVSGILLTVGAGLALGFASKAVR